MRLAIIALVLAPLAARADGRPPYAWLAAPATEDDLATRFAPPPGATRVPLVDGSFGAWLRHLPLRPVGTPVRLFDGRVKPRQDVHAAVVDLDVGPRDLQQCADAVMRLRAEYLYATGREASIRFRPDARHELAYQGGRDRGRFARYLVQVFAEAGTASLADELPRPRIRAREVLPGDVLIQGGSPGHAVLVLDAADGPDGKRWLLVGQSYMPAQDFHVLRNLSDEERSPWYDADALAAGGLATPEWRPFTLRDLRRFPSEKR